MSRIRLAVIGTGHLGRIHAKLAGELDDAELVAVVDPDLGRCRAIAKEHECRAAAHHSEVGCEFDAAIVAAPNAFHAEVGCDLLRQGVHVLMEKPLARTVAETDQLLTAAAERGAILQVGHVERFNPAFEAAKQAISSSPKYIEARRTSGYPARSTDIGVVLDLMIHDIDLVLSLAQSELQSVSAFGASVLGGHEDMAQARLVFRNGCIADLIASRVSYEARRTMNIYSRTAIVDVDFHNRTANLVTPSQSINDGSLIGKHSTAAEQSVTAERLYDSLLQRKTLSVRDSNAILEEQLDFITAIRNRHAPRVAGEAGRQAVLVAEQILASLQQHQWNGTPAGPVGPHALPEAPILRPAAWTAQQPQRKAG